MRTLFQTVKFLTFNIWYVDCAAFNWICGFDVLQMIFFYFLFTFHTAPNFFGNRIVLLQYTCLNRQLTDKLQSVTNQLHLRADTYLFRVPIHYNPPTQFPSLGFIRGLLVFALILFFMHTHIVFDPFVALLSISRFAPFRWMRICSQR